MINQTMKNDSENLLTVLMIAVVDKQPNGGGPCKKRYFERALTAHPLIQDSIPLQVSDCIWYDRIAGFP